MLANPVLFSSLMALLGGAENFAQPLEGDTLAQAREWTAQMRTNLRGPYRGVMWFCNDGEVLAPQAYACAEHGGGLQYGVLSREAERLAQWGIPVGTILAATTAEELVESNYYRIRALIIERYLERSLDGWVLHQAKSYRGFRQVEDEEKAAERLLAELGCDQRLIGPLRYLFLRLTRALPYGGSSGLADEVRALAGLIGDADPAFAQLRYKIHAFPEPADMEGVNAYAQTRSARQGEDTLVRQARDLAAKMGALYDVSARLARLEDVRRWLRDERTRALIERFVEIPPQDTPRLLRTGAALIQAAAAAVRPGSGRQGQRNLLLIHVMAVVEELWIGVTADLRQRRLLRQEALEMTHLLLTSGFHLGVFSEREYRSTLEALSQMTRGKPQAYADGLAHMGRALQWARARVLSDVGLPLARYQAVEGHALAVVDDILRSGVVLPLATILDRLALDVEGLRGGGHRLAGFDTDVTVQLRGENPGLARGRLNVVAPGEDPDQLARHEIVLLHDLPPDLPPVAGLLTVGPAGSLSHVALLARNLGIPHASIGAAMASKVAAWTDQEVLLGVSQGRRVMLGPVTAFAPAGEAGDAPLRVQDAPSSGARFTIDADCLELGVTGALLLDEVGPNDSGVLVGPKAAELARLKRLFPERVSDAVVLPFGAFVRHVDRGGPNGEPSPLAELRQAYAAHQGEAAILEALARFRQAIMDLPFQADLAPQVLLALAQLGQPGRFGVFVRSDTNVEDLEEFTGAGLNLTVPNRVDPKEILASVRAVWASPFTERSFRWRQQLLSNPEHVYPSVILHKTVASEISGVMVTMDLETTGPGLTISASEGVAAVVDGGAPETLVVRPDGKVILLASSRTATRKLIPQPPRQGVVVAPAEGRDPLLSDSVITELTGLAKEVAQRVESPEEGIPWDIEFGIAGGKAFLMQLRPLRTSEQAAMHPALRALDERSKFKGSVVDLLEALP